VTMSSAPDAGVSFAHSWGSALRAGVLSSCFAKKKVAKEEGDPRVGAPFGGPLRYSASRAAAELGPTGLKQSSPKAPGQPALLSASQGDPKSVAVQPTNAGITGGLPGPLGGAEQRRNAGGFWLALSEPQASLASHPAFRVAQGTRQRRAPTQGWPFLWLLSFGHTKESTPASKAEPQACKWKASSTPLPQPHHTPETP